MTATTHSTGSSFFAEIGRALRYWPAVLISGVLLVIAGVLALVWPVVTALVIGILFGATILVQGVLFAAAAFSSRPGTPGRVWIGVWAVLSIVLGVFTLAYPGTGALAAAYLLIIWFLISAVNDFVRASSGPDHRAWFIVLGVLQVVLAVWLTFDLALAVDTVALLFAFGLLLRGFAEIALAFRLRHVGKLLGGK